MKILILILLATSMAGCTTSYHHISDPRIANDGYDLLCGGFKKEVGNWQASGELCQNVAPYGGQFIHTSITYNHPWSLK